jgi:hypothetical protein
MLVTDNTFSLKKLRSVLGRLEYGILEMVCTSLCCWHTETQAEEESELKRQKCTHSPYYKTIT